MSVLAPSSCPVLLLVAVTGDFSKGAQGFWIENGELTFPVSEITIAANFDEILKGIDAVADEVHQHSREPDLRAFQQPDFPHNWINGRVDYAGDVRRTTVFVVAGLGIDAILGNPDWCSCLGR